MTKNEKAQILREATDADFGGKLSELSYEAAELVHKNPRTGMTRRFAAALLYYQAMQFNGEWDMNAVNETFDFMAKVIILD